MPIKSGKNPIILGKVAEIFKICYRLDTLSNIFKIGNIGGIVYNPQVVKEVDRFKVC